MPPVLGNYPDAELVMCAWLLSIPNINIDYADWRLPWDLDMPNVHGYAQVTVINGAPDQNVPLFHTVAQVDSYVLTPSEDRTYRLKASALAKQIQYACYDRIHVHRVVTPKETLPNGEVITYRPALVESAYTMTEPHQIANKDNAMYEGYSMDMAFTWTCGIDTN